MTAGRPTVLSEEMIEQAWAYLVDHNGPVPSIAGLSLVLKISRSTVYEWSRVVDSEFSYIVSDLMAIQEEKLLNGGLSSNYNASIAKLMLTKHGYTDRQEIKAEVQATAADLTGDQLDARVQALMNAAKQG